MDNSVKKAAWASAKFNGDFYCIETYSGFRGGSGDPLGKQHLLPPDVINEVLGAALLDALNHSRFITDEKELRSFNNYEKRKTDDAKWVSDLILRFGYRNKQRLFKSMESCLIECREELLTITPFTHEKLEGWGREKDDGIEDVVINKNATPEEVGAALRLAFERCVS